MVNIIPDLIKAILFWFDFKTLVDYLRCFFTP